MLLLLCSLPGGCALWPWSHEPAPSESELRPGVVSRTLNLMRGSPDRIETAGRKGANRLHMEVQTTPQPLKLSKTRRLSVQVRISNPTKKTLSLQFPTTQRLEITLQTADGRVIERWSEDRAFSNMIGHLAVNPGERVEFNESLSVREARAGSELMVEASVPGYPDLVSKVSVTPEP